MVTVLTPSSAKSFAAPAYSPSMPQTVSRSLWPPGARARFGALRTGDVAHNPSLWDVDVSQSGKMCVADPAKLQPVAPEQGRGRGKVSIRSARRPGADAELGGGQGARGLAQGAAGQVRRAISDRMAGQPATRATIDFVTVSKPPSDLVGAAKVLIANGCQNQLDLLVDKREQDQD